MTELFGFTRNVVKEKYALLTPSGFVPSNLPGWEKAVCNVLISPAMGARFSQVLITMEKDGQCMGNTAANQYFVYVLHGSASVLFDEKRHRLDAGGFAYVPSGKDVQIRSGSAGSKLLIFQKAYRALPGVPKPAGFSGHEREIRGQPFLGNEEARLQV